ncbi:MAG: SRPBCC family protein [Pyrinomonadaceae bacterium]
MNNEQLRTSKSTSEPRPNANAAALDDPRHLAAPRPAAPRRSVKHTAPARRDDPAFDGLLAGLLGIGAGAAAMFLLDPNRGGRRRAVLSDKLSSLATGLPDAAGVTARDLSNRARGVWAGATRLFTSDDPSDQVLEARVRSKLGRVVSHPSAVRVTARDGAVTLEGRVPESELPALLSTVHKVRGVGGIDNRLETHDTAGGDAELQGGPRREGERWELMQANWSPAARLGAAAFGLGLGAVGAALVARSLTNTDMRRLTGIGAGRSAVTIDKSITVDAPVDVLFALWSHFENFPRFMSNVLEIRDLGGGRSRWRVAGPAGIPVEWDAEITRTVQNELIAWRSVEGSTVENAGYVVFEPADGGATEVSVHLSYNPPAGALGHAVARLFGADPGSEMDEDLMRMKTMLETGQAPRDAARPLAFDRRRSDRVH